MPRSVLATGNHGIELQLDYGDFVDSDTGGGVTHNTHSVELEWLEAWFDANGYTTVDSINVQSASGNLVHDVEWSNSLPYVSGRYRLRTLSPESVSLSFTEEQTGSVSLTSYGIDTAGSMSGSLNFTIPRRPYGTPREPSVSMSGGTATCSGRQTNANADRFWEYTDWRLETDGVWDDWSPNEPGRRTSKTITLDPNKRYRASVRGRNIDTTGPWGYSGYVYSAPSSPSALTATRQATRTTVLLSWTNNAAYASAYLIERALDGGAWIQIGTTSATSYSTTLPLSSTAQYRVRAQTPAPAVQSSYTAAVEVGVGYNAPDAPTISLARIDDASATLTIAPGQTNAALDKYWQLLYWELQTDDGVFTPVSSSSGDTPTIAVSGLAADHRYTVRVRAWNVGGYSDYGSSNPIYTTPAPPTAVLASRAGLTAAVNVSWTNNARWPGTFTLERSVNSGAYVVFQNVPASPTIDSLLTTSYGVYRVRVNTPNPSVTSAFSASSAVVVPVESDKRGLPGINKIYSGTTEVFRVLAGTKQIWLG